MSFLLNYVIRVKSCHSCQIMSFMSNHVIHVKSCHVIIHFMCHWDRIQLSREGGGQICLPRPSADRSTFEAFSIKHYLPGCNLK
jgi:hypothetical protein